MLIYLCIVLVIFEDLRFVIFYKVTRKMKFRNIFIIPEIYVYYFLESTSPFGLWVAARTFLVAKSHMFQPWNLIFDSFPSLQFDLKENCISDLTAYKLSVKKHYSPKLPDGL